MRSAARLAALVNLGDKALALGANSERLHMYFKAAVEDMCVELRVLPSGPETR